MTPQKVLPNNNTPPTHFIEVYSDSGGSRSSIVFDIQALMMCLNSSSISHCKTICIFKIHPKQ